MRIYCVREVFTCAAFRIPVALLQIEIYGILRAVDLKGTAVMINDILLIIMEWIGTIAFSVSGSLVAISCGLDLFGVLTVGCITATGGGMMRDIILGNIPPQIFSNTHILLVAMLTSLAVFIIAYANSRRFNGLRERIDIINNFFDALGLAVFSLTGVEIAHGIGASGDVVLSITAGVLSGVGGGVLRDVLVNEKPYVLTKHIYAVASVLGSSIYYVMSIWWNHRILGTLVCISLVLFIRLMAAKYHWRLPKIKLDEEESCRKG